jgi:hypothetical protein
MSSTPDVKFTPPEPSDTDSDRALRIAKKLVSDNYNRHHDIERTSPLFPEDIYIIWYAKLLTNWKALLGTPEIRGLLWMVTYNGFKHDAQIEIYKRVNSVTVREENIP